MPNITLRSKDRAAKAARQSPAAAKSHGRQKNPAMPKAKPKRPGGSGQDKQEGTGKDRQESTRAYGCENYILDERNGDAHRSYAIPITQLELNDFTN
uniref:Uncharacterized protein n=1 Tax=Strigamia maritima TaxID=126957 RepID=T1J9V1_STRMM